MVEDVGEAVFNSPFIDATPISKTHYILKISKSFPEFIKQLAPLFEQMARNKYPNIPTNVGNAFESLAREIATLEDK